jgi:hypothetical protein
MHEGVPEFLEPLDRGGFDVGFIDRDGHRLTSGWRPNMGNGGLRLNKQVVGGHRVRYLPSASVALHLNEIEAQYGKYRANFFDFRKRDSEQCIPP